MADIESNKKQGDPPPQGVVGKAWAQIAPAVPVAGWCTAVALAVALAGVMSGGSNCTTPLAPAPPMVRASDGPLRASRVHVFRFRPPPRSSFGGGPDTHARPAARRLTRPGCATRAGTCAAIPRSQCKHRRVALLARVWRRELPQPRRVNALDTHDGQRHRRGRAFCDAHLRRSSAAARARRPGRASALGCAALLLLVPAWLAPRGARRVPPGGQLWAARLSPLTHGLVGHPTCLLELRRRRARAPA